MAKYTNFRNFIYASQGPSYDEPLLLRRWHLLAAIYELSKDQRDITLTDINKYMMETFDYSPPIKGLIALMTGYEKFGVVQKQATHLINYYEVNRFQTMEVFKYIKRDIGFILDILSEVDDDNTRTD